MSKFKAKAAEVVEQGTAQRGSFEPTGVPLRIYKWWAERTNKPPKRENFCHFWRVVAIWAPLMFLRKKIVAFFQLPVTVPVILGLVAVAIVYACIISNDVLFTIGAILGTFVGLAVTVWGIMSGISATLTDEKRDELDLPRGKFLIAGFVLGFPAAVIAFLAMTVNSIVGEWFKENWKGLLGGVALVGIFTGWVLAAIAYGPAGFFGAAILSAALFVLFNKGITAFAEWSERLANEQVAAHKAKQDFEYDYFLEHGVWPEDDREPGRVAKFFAGIVDFIIFIGQVIRVNKWKICPIVEVK